MISSSPIWLSGDSDLYPLFQILIDPDMDPILPKRFRQARLVKLLQTISVSSSVHQKPVHFWKFFWRLHIA